MMFYQVEAEIVGAKEAIEAYNHKRTESEKAQRFDLGNLSGHYHRRINYEESILTGNIQKKALIKKANSTGGGNSFWG